MTILKGNQVTVLDLDLTSLGSLTLSANQTYVVGGIAITKFNTANESTAAVIDSTGLTITPVSASDYNAGTRTVPGVFIPLQQIVPGLRSDMGMRLWAVNSANNNSANFDNAIIGIDTGSTAFGYVFKRGTGTTGAGTQTFINANAVNVSGLVSDLYTLGATNNVMVLEIPSIVGSAYRAYRGALAGGTWPAMESLTQHNSYTLSGTINTTGVTPQSLGIVLAGQRAGSGTAYAVKFTRIRLDLFI